MSEMGMRYMTEQEAADYLNLSTKTLQKWRYQGNAPAYHKFGKIVRYRQSELEEFANSSRIEPVR